MDCAQFREIVHDLDRAETRGFALRASALDHAETCSACSALLDDVEFLDFALTQMTAEDAEKQAPPQLEAALLEEFRRQRVAEVRPKKSLVLAALSIAAAFALMVGAGLHYWIAGKRVPAGRTAVVSGPETAGQLEGDAGAMAADEENANGDEDFAYATDFVSLPYADDPATLEEGTVVRVMLSRSALASFGVPVADLGAADQIPADIALSEDGAPQAIRLVAEDDLDRAN